MFDFGFKSVKEEEKKSLVSSVFSSVASKYDLMNNLMSFGVQGFWKKNFVDLVSLKDGGRYLDLACGSGDISKLILQKAKQEGKKISLVLCDANQEMLDVAQKNIFSGENISFIKSFAEDLPFNENEFDGIFISFGIRNFTNVNESLGKIYSCLKKEGSLYILEFFSDVSSQNSSFFSKIYKFHLLNFIPNLGKIIVSDKESYKYFGESIIKFHTMREFKNLLQSANFRFFSNVKSFLNIVGFFHFKK
jgi:demethylmenaquinone methyltransferase/2-methoxy-6-polyprenyl-1,4-benzoquinol methylase